MRTLSTYSAAMASSSALSNKYKFETLLVSSPKDHIYHVQLNRPQQLNAMNSAFWRLVLVLKLANSSLLALYELYDDFFWLIEKWWSAFKLLAKTMIAEL